MGNLTSIEDYRKLVGAKRNDSKARMTAAEYNSTFGGKKVAVRADKRSKYGNRKVIVEGIKFDSEKEGNRYRVLKIAEFGGEISNLRLQKVYELKVEGRKVCKYKADFVYIRNGVEVVEDVKSEITRKARVYRIKKKLMKAIYGIDILET